MPEAGAIAGHVPSELVGSWVRASYGATDRIRLNADGTGYYQTALTDTGPCSLTQNTIWDGTAVVDATRITIYATTVTNTRFECGKKTDTIGSPEVLQFSYVYDAGADVLSTIDQTCAAKYPDSPSSQSLYCKNVYARE
jgi:hypothetical protein